MIEKLKKSLQRIKSKKHLALNISYYFIASIVGAAIQLVLNPFLALKLEYFDYAIVGYYTSFNSLLAPLIVFSLSAYYCRQYFLVPEETRPRLRNTISILSLTLSFILAAISFIGLVVYCKVSGSSLPFFPYAMFSVATAFFNGVYTILVVDLRMGRKARKFLGVHISHATVSAISAILMVIILGLGAYGRMLATMLTSVMFASYAAKTLITKWEIDQNHVRKALSFCWPLTAAAMLGYFFTGVDRAMLERINDVKSFGLYNIAVQMAGYLGLFTAALNQTFQPDIYKSIANRNLKKTVLIIAGILGLGLIPIAVFIIFAPQILHVLTYGRFTEAAAFARILSLKNLSMGLYYSLSGMLEGYGLAKTVLLSRIFGSVVTTAMFQYLIQKFGFFGAAWGQVLSFLIMSVISIALFIVLKKWSKPMQEIFLKPETTFPTKKDSDASTDL